MDTNKKSDTIKNKNEIDRIKKYLRDKNDFVNDRHLLYFILGINTCIRPKDLLTLKWDNLIDMDKNIVYDYIIYNGYHFSLNNTCKKYLYYYVKKYKEKINFEYVFSVNGKPFSIQTINYKWNEIERSLNLDFNFTSQSLHRTFIYWQIKEYNYDYVKIEKLRRLIYKSKQDSLYIYSGYDINDDLYYINDVNL